jgi:hypothetical protein
MERDEPDDNAIEIAADGDRERRWAGVATYVVLLACVAGVTAALLRRLTGSLWLAIVLVAFMMGYMLVVGWLTSRNLRGRS